MSLVGEHIDRYRILHLLGSGGMGDVYLAEDARIGQQVAIKVIRAEASPYPEAGTIRETNRLFQREAKAIVRLDHPNILPLFDYGEEQIGDTTLIYLVMPYRWEGSLTTWLRQRNGAGLLSPQDIAHIVRQAAEALQHAHHHQIIHQDVKPSNFLIRSIKETPDRPHVLLADFGIARLATATASASQSVRGTPSYMAPEQWEGKPVPATDQYALAVMAYELLTGRLPFQGGPAQMMYQHIHEQPKPPSTFNSQLSKEVDTVLMHALAKTPENRFASVSAFANAFQQAVPGMLAAHEFLNVETAEKISQSSVPTGLVTSIPTAQQETADVEITGGKEIEDLSVKTEIAALVSNVNKSSRHRARNRPLFVVMLVCLVLALAGSGIAYGITVLLENGSGVPGAASSATVMITPKSQYLNNVFTISAITGTPDVSRNQVRARLLSTTPPSQSQTVNATGVGMTQGTHATGILTIYNSDQHVLTFNAGSVLANFNTPKISMMFDATVNVPAGSTQIPTIATAPAHVVQAGTIGNIGAGVFLELGVGIFNNGGWKVQNNSAFSGGQDPQPYTAVQQSDIDGAASTIENAHAPDAQLVLQAQIQANERLIGSPQCKPNVTSDHKVGDAAMSVTVTVTFNCGGEVYDYDGARSMAMILLNAQATKELGTGYALVGNMITALTNATVMDAKQGTISLAISAEGVWAFRFSDVQKQALAKLIAGKKKSGVQALLLAQQGVELAEIQFSGETLPTNKSQINIVVLTVPGVRE